MCLIYGIDWFQVIELQLKAEVWMFKYSAQSQRHVQIGNKKTGLTLIYPWFLTFLMLCIEHCLEHINTENISSLYGGKTISLSKFSSIDNCFLRLNAKKQLAGFPELRFCVLRHDSTYVELTLFGIWVAHQYCYLSF